jgi:serine/threonine-protein kinase
MHKPAPFDPESLPLEVEQQVDRVCVRFENAWRSGPPPRIEDCLQELPASARSALLRELIKLDLVYRRRAGQTPTPDDYRRRFPDLPDLGELSSLLDPLTPVNDPADPERPSAGRTPRERYQLGQAIGQGGMGTVLHGHDPDLGRAVAVKVLLPQHQEHPGLVQRFLEEARIAGGLQHPGVVPVYERGTFADGRPYFTMKLVQGRTLADLLAERSGPGQELPRFLKVFEQVCQALAFAHAGGVIHRDLKPANVMVGAFGEVHVMDWGLAKVLHEGGVADEEQASRERQRPEGSTVPPPGAHAPRSPELSDERTRTGAVLGTPAYMAPEQARGETALLDRRCDVFGLGAVLCQILTGQAPYVGSAPQVQRDARAGQLTAAFWRLDDCGADAELVRLAKACLHALVAERPRDAGVVAEAVSAYLAGVQERLRQAELERAAAQAREGEAQARAQAQGQAWRAERRARRRPLGLAGALVAGLLLGGWWWWERQARGADTLQEVTRALGKAEQLRDDAQRIAPNDLTRAETALALWKQGLATVEQAERAMTAGLADETTRERVQTLRRELEQGERDATRDFAMATRLEETRLRLSEMADGPHDGDTIAREYATGFKEYGIDVLQLPEDEAAARLGSRVIKEHLAFGLDDWAMYVSAEVASRLLRIASRVDVDPWRNRVRQAKQNKDMQALRDLAGSETLRDQPAGTLVLLALALHGSPEKKDR